MRARIALVFVAAVVAGCLLPSVEDLQPKTAASGPIRSCAALKASSPNTPDGYQTIDPDADGPIAPFRAWCDMTNDGGGWMLVSPELALGETPQETTSDRSIDDHGGVVLRVYMNALGCGKGTKSRHRVYVDDRPAWSLIRFKQTFAGHAGCWHVFGGAEPDWLPPNVIAFDRTLDKISNASRMGGSNGDAFDGVCVRCDTESINFWNAPGTDLRSATVILRRAVATLPAGLETGADCGDYAPGKSSPTWWEYRDIYVK